MTCFSFCIITIGTDIYLPEIFRLRILYLITEHTDFLVLKPYAGQAMTENKIIIPIWKKSNLTVEEADRGITNFSKESVVEMQARSFMEYEDK